MSDELPANFEALTKDEARIAVHDKLLSAVRARRSDRKGLNYGHRAKSVELIYAEAEAAGLRHALQVPAARMVELACRVWGKLSSRLRPEARPAAAAARPAAAAARPARAFFHPLEGRVVEAPDDPDVLRALASIARRPNLRLLPWYGSRGGGQRGYSRVGYDHDQRQCGDGDD